MNYQHIVNRTFILVLTSCSYAICQNKVSPWTIPSWSSDSEKIAYASHDGNDWEIFSINVNSGKVTQLTDNNYDDSNPSWSPDGSNLLIESNQDGNVEIYVIDLKKKTRKRLTNNPAEDSEPTFSPDGNQIAFTSHRYGDPQIFLMDVNGKNLQQLTIQGRNEMPGWSPDSRRITYHTNWIGHWEIMVIDRDSKNLWSPTHDPDEQPYGKWNANEGKYIGCPVFSADGKEVAFHAAPERTSFGIYAVDLSSLKIRKIVDSQTNESFPAWSPDGARIAFRHEKEGEWGLYTVSSDGSNLKLLTKITNPD